MHSKTHLIWLDKNSLSAKKSTKQRDLARIWRSEPSTIGADDDFFSKVPNLVWVDLEGCNVYATF